MTDYKSGVANCIQDIEPREVFTHYCGHSLNLAVSDSVKACRMMKDVLETVREITKLITFSPRREAILRAVKEEVGSDAAGIRVPCPTRWTVRHDSIASIIDNYEELKLTFDKSKKIFKDTEMKTRIIGVESKMNEFDFLSGLLVSEFLFRNCDNLSKA